MTSSITLIESNLTQKDLKSKKVKILSIIPFKSKDTSGPYLTVKLDDSYSFNLDNTLLLLSTCVQNSFKTVDIGADDVIYLVAYNGKVYKILSELEFYAHLGTRSKLF